MPVETPSNTRSALQGLDAVWRTEEMVGLHRDWLDLVARKQRAAQEYSSYSGGDYRVVGWLAVAMAVAQSAVRIAHRAMLHRFDQLARGVGLLVAKVAGLSMAAADDIRREGQTLRVDEPNVESKLVAAVSELKVDSSHQDTASVDLYTQAPAVHKPTGFDRIFDNLSPRRIAYDWPRRRRGLG